MSGMEGKAFLFALPALVFAALGYLYLRLGSVKPEEDGDAIPLRTLFSEKQRRISALCTAVFGTALAVCSVLRFHDTAEYTLRLLFILTWLVPVALIDGRCHVIQNRMVLAGFAAFLLFTLGEWLILKLPLAVLLKNAGLGLAMGFGVFALCALLSKGGMGAGDVKLFSVLGLLLGWEGVFLLIFLTTLFIAVTGIILILRKQKEKSSRLPAGPFVLLAMAAAMLLGV